MSDSYPTIQDSLSEMQKEFMGCVEMHVDPPEDHGPSYAADATYRCDDSPLPGELIRFTVSVDETDPDISARTHSIEFLGEDDGKPVGRVAHSIKRIESWQGRFFWTETQFRVSSPEFPSGEALEEQVELEVREYVERVKALDRARRLVEI